MKKEKVSWDDSFRLRILFEFKHAIEKVLEIASLKPSTSKDLHEHRQLITTEINKIIEENNGVIV